MTTVTRIIDEGVYYRRQDYAGLWRRAFVSTVDGMVAFVALLVLVLIDVTLIRRGGVLVAFVTWLVLCYGYFVVCKRTHTRTLGYRLGRVRLVDIHGEAPSTWTVTYRLLLSLMGILSTGYGVFDLFWITADDHRQALRDKITHTYVIKASAQPAGRGPIVCNAYQIMCWSLLLREVQRTIPSSRAMADRVLS